MPEATAGNRIKKKARKDTGVKLALFFEELFGKPD